jgi:hypothetical protein
MSTGTSLLETAAAILGSFSLVNIDIRSGYAILIPTLADTYEISSYEYQQSLQQ